MKKTIITMFIAFLLLISYNCVKAAEQVNFNELVKKQSEEIDAQLTENEKNKLIEVLKRVTVAKDEFKRQCSVAYNKNLVLFYFPDTKTMSLSIHGSIEYFTNGYVTFTELGLKYNDLIMTLPITTTSYEIIPNSCRLGTCNFKNGAFAIFDKKEMPELQALFNNCDVVAIKHWYGYSNSFQCSNGLNWTYKLYPTLSYVFVFGLFPNNIGMHDLLFFASLLQKIGYNWI